jgi:predicted nucleic acid-binding protein
MTVFVDTSAFYAVFDRDDANHRAAKEVWTRLLREGTPLFTSNYVLLETTALLQHRLGVVAVRSFHEDVAPLLRIEWVTAELHRAGVEAVLTAARKKLSLVDCVSFQSMRQLGIRTAFCFDAHFGEQGFATEPR